MFYMMKFRRFIPISVEAVRKELESKYGLFNRWDNIHCVCKFQDPPLPEYMRNEWELVLPPGRYSKRFLKEIYERVMK